MESAGNMLISNILYKIIRCGANLGGRNLVSLFYLIVLYKLEVFTYRKIRHTLARRSNIALPK